MTLSPKTRKILMACAAVLLPVYIAFASVVWWSMNQPPEIFGQVMAKLPGPVAFLIFPFETAWLRARAGHLKVGDPAPDFSLMRQDKSGTVQLSALTRQQPVVLVFGSYT
jgi:hypothetical protein